MKKKTIDFRELLERVLPLEDLPAADRFQVQRALELGVTSRIEEAAMYALSRLEQGGAVRRMATRRDEGAEIVQFQPRDTIDVITIARPAPRERDGLRVIPRASLPEGPLAAPGQIGRLLKLSDPVLSGDPRRGSSRADLAAHLDRLAHDVLGPVQVRLVFPDTENGDDTRLGEGLAQEALDSPDQVFYFPDLSVLSVPPGMPRRHGSAAMLGMAAGGPLGVLEVVSERKNAFRPEDLTRVVLLADYCAGVLERAASIERLVFVDALTSVYNRSFFDLQLGNEMARAQRDGNSMALFIADIDDFKAVNTTYGYEAGNLVLTQVAHALRGGVRPFDTVARWGGEEFTVLLSAPVQAGDAEAIAERLRGLVERQVVPIEALDRTTHRVMVTVSIGGALFPDHGANAADLWRAANQALLQAKHPPKNQVVFFRP